MSNYVEYVVCKHADSGKPYLFYAPLCSNLKNGDEVLVDTQFGKRRATVLASYSTCSDDLRRLLCALAGAEDKPIKRVIGKFTEFEYEEDETNE